MQAILLCMLLMHEHDCGVGEQQNEPSVRIVNGPTASLTLYTNEYSSAPHTCKLRSENALVTLRLKAMQLNRTICLPLAALIATECV